jgi:hypothetical protein
VSDTPMTDNVIEQMTKPYESADVDMVLILCRGLERQLAEANRKNEHLTSLLKSLYYAMDGESKNVPAFVWEDVIDEIKGGGR